jgi:hypothetical protein
MGSVNVSIEVKVPPSTDLNSLIAVGKRCAPAEWRDVMNPAEALQWAFSDPGGPQMLAQIGIEWNALVNGVKL